MSTQKPACMGGWCKLREKCADYQADPREYPTHVQPVERLCTTRDIPRQLPERAPEVIDEEPEVWPVVQRHRPKGTWERRHTDMMRKAGPFDGLGL